jgi:hypothetical protein
MGNNCEQIRQLLVELRYGELDEIDSAQVEAHLEQCAACRERHAAYGAVVADLKLWDDIEPQPSRVAFVAMHGGPAVPPAQPMSSNWVRGLAVAASFAMGIFLAAAFVNMEIASGADGWRVSTSLWPRAEGNTTAQPADPGALPAQPVAGGSQRATGPVTPVTTGGPRIGVPGPQGEVTHVMSQAELDGWLEDRLRDRGLFGQPASLDQLSPDQIAPVLDQLIAERDGHLRILVQEIVNASEQRQRAEVDDALAGMYQTFDVQRANDLLFLASEMGVIQETTGLELQRTNAAIDYLITRAARNPDGQQEQQ